MIGLAWASNPDSPGSAYHDATDSATEAGLLSTSKRNKNRTVRLMCVWLSAVCQVAAPCNALRFTAANVDTVTESRMSYNG